MDLQAQELQAVAASEAAPIVAVTGRVSSVFAIEGADRIQQAVVDCGDQGIWSGVVSKDLAAGQPVIVLLQDALLPPGNERWAFMESRHWRVRMARFKGAASECVILPATDDEALLEVGADIGASLGITKFSKPIPATMVGKAKGNFPSFIPKTDEPNFQRVRDRDRLMFCDWYATEKADGTSCTVYNDGEIHVCSRNWELEDGDNLYWNMARKYGLCDLVPEDFALQFEIVGPGVQGNPMGLADNEIRVFTGYNFKHGERIQPVAFASLCGVFGLPMAKVICTGFGPRTNADLQKLAEIKYDNGRPGEGIVIRGARNEFSFKVLSLRYDG